MLPVVVHLAVGVVGVLIVIRRELPEWLDPTTGEPSRLVRLGWRLPALALLWALAATVIADWWRPGRWLTVLAWAGVGVLILASAPRGLPMGETGTDFPACDLDGRIVDVAALTAGTGVGTPEVGPATPPPGSDVGPPGVVPTLRWCSPLGGQNALSATNLVLVAGRTLVVLDGRLLALDAATGERRWRTDDLGLLGPLATDGATVYATAAEGLVALDLADGKRRWESTAGATLGPPLVADGTAYLAVNAYGAPPPGPRRRPRRGHGRRTLAGSLRLRQRSPRPLGPAPDGPGPGRGLPRPP